MSNAVEVQRVNSAKKMKFPLIAALNMALRAFFNKPTNDGFKSQTYKLVRFILMTLGLVTLTYYKAMLNAALNVDVNNIPIESWDDLLNSDYKLLVVMEAVNEDRFKFGDDTMRKIHKEKILTVNPEKQLQNVGFQGSIPAILKDKYVAFDNVLIFKALDEYPCQIIDVKSSSMR